MKKMLLLLLFVFFLCCFNVYAEESDNLNGFQIIDGNTYYYIEDEMYKGLLELDGCIYMFGRSSGQMQYGWFDYDWDGRNDYYFDKNTGIAVKGKQEIDGKKYYFNEDGKMYTGVYTDDAGNVMMYGRSSGQMQYGWFDYDWDGRNDYYFDKNTGIAVKGKQEIDGKKYYFNEDGKMYTGVYTDDTGNVMMYGRSSGQMQYGWFDYDWDGRNDYYFDKNTGIAVKGKQEIDGKKYYFNEDGKMYTGVYTDDTGNVMMYGRSSGQMQYGWFDYDWDGRNDYYFDKNTGIAVKGKQEIDGKKYYFNEDGKMYTGVYTDDAGNVMMYGRSSGQMQYGWFDYDWDGRNDYYFDKNTGIAVKGKQEIDGKKYYFNEDGKMYTGVYTDDAGNVMMYGRSSGQMQYGWFDYDWDGRNDYYFDKKTGIALRDLNVIDDGTYMFGRSSCKVQYGWFDYDWDGNKEYYFDVDTGIMVTGMRIIDGVPHYFRSDGIFVSKNFSLYIDVSKYQKNIDWDKVKNTNIYGAILRLGYGTSYLDPCVEDEYFSTYYRESVRTGLFQGIYFYSYALNAFSAQAEANYVIEKLKQYNVPKNTYLYYDLEENPWTKNLNKGDYDIIIKSFINKLKEAGYYNVSVYTYKFWAENKLSSWAQTQVQWIAQYSDRCTFKGSNYRGWQFTSSGHVDGISTEVDMSYFN